MFLEFILHVAVIAAIAGCFGALITLFIDWWLYRDR